MKRIAFLSLPLVLATAAYAQNSPLDSGNFPIKGRSTNNTSQMVARTEPMRNTEILSVEPIFEQVPFLKLRAGDQLVRSERYFQHLGKGDRAADVPFEWSTPSVYLKRAGKNYLVWGIEKEGRLQQPAPSQLSLFTWELTRANADALFEICQPKPSLSVTQLARLDSELKTDFAKYLSADLKPLFAQADKIVLGFLYEKNEGGQKKFVYGGFAYNEETREVFRYRLTLGADELIQERAILITAPPKPVSTFTGGQAFTGRVFIKEKPWEKSPEGIKYQKEMAPVNKFNAIISKVLEKTTP